MGIQRFFTLILAFALCLVLPACENKDKSKLEHYNKGLSAFKGGDNNTAIIELKIALEKDPNYFEARYYLGNAYLNTGKFESAERELKKAIKLNPSFGDALLPLARSLHAENKLDEALDTVQKRIKNAPQDIDAIEVEAMIRADRNEVKEARKLLDDVLAKEPKRMTAYLVMGGLAMKAEALDDARQAFTKAAELGARDVRPYFSLALVERRRNNDDKAIEYFNKVVELDPKSIAALSEIGMIRITQNRLDDAMKSAEKLLAADKDRPEGYYIRGVVNVRKGKPAEAIIDLQKVLSVNPGHAASNFFLGQALYEKGEYEQAITALRKAREEGAGMYQPDVMLSMIYASKGYADDAVTAAKAAVQKAPNAAVTHHALGGAYMLKKEFDLAYAEYQKATDLDPNFSDAYIQKGALQLKAGKGDAAAMREFDAAIKVDPKNVRPRLTAAVFQLQQGQFAKVVETCQKGMTGDTSDALLYNLMGIAQTAMKEDASAVRSFEKSISMAPKFAAPYQHLAEHYMARGSVEKAVAQFDALVRANPQDMRGVLAAAALYERLGKTDKARELYQTAKSAGTAQGYLALGAFYARGGDTAKAEDMADELLKKEPDNLAAREFKGLLYFQKKDAEKGKKEFEDIKRAKPDHPIGYTRLAAAYEATGNYDSAIRELKEASRVAPKDRQVLGQMASVQLKKGDFSSASATADSIIKMDPENGMGYYLKGLSYMGMKREDDALNYTLKADKLSPGNGQIKMTIAGIQASKGKLDDAMSTYQETLRAIPGSSGVLNYNMAVVLEKKGDRKGAVEYYRKAIEAAPDHVLSLNNLAFIYADTETRTDEAVKLAERAVSKAKGNAALSDTLGWALYKTGKVDEALTHLQAAVSGMPDNPSVQYHLGVALLAKGKKDEGKAALQKALKTPKFPERKAVEGYLERM